MLRVLSRRRCWCSETFAGDIRFVRMSLHTAPVDPSPASWWQASFVKKLALIILAYKMLRYELSSSGISMVLLGEYVTTSVDTNLALKDAVRRLMRNVCTLCASWLKPILESAAPT